MHRILAVAVAVLALGAAPFASLAGADPAPTAPAVATATPAPKANDPKMLICRSVETTGSRLGGRRACMTKAEWDDQARVSRQGFTDEIARGGGIVVPGK